MLGVDTAKDAKFMRGDGVLGFGRDENGDSKTLDQLYGNNVIQRKMLTFSLENLGDESFAYIGGVPKYVNTSNITWTPLESNYEWSAKLVQMDFNKIADRKQIA